MRCAGSWRCIQGSLDNNLSAKASVPKRASLALLSCTTFSVSRLLWELVTSTAGMLDEKRGESVSLSPLVHSLPRLYFAKKSSMSLAKATRFESGSTPASNRTNVLPLASLSIKASFFPATPTVIGA